MIPIVITAKKYYRKRRLFYILLYSALILFGFSISLWTYLAYIELKYAYMTTGFCIVMSLAILIELYCFLSKETKISDQTELLRIDESGIMVHRELVDLYSANKIL